jgi:reactive intermediate/imine deaminase
MRRRITGGAGVPAPRGSYSAGVAIGAQVFVAGQVPVDPATGRLVAGDVLAQARQALDNLEAVLLAAGASLDDVVRATVYLADLDDFDAADEAWQERFGGARPARTTIGCALRPGVRYEVDAIAVTGAA